MGRCSRKIPHLYYRTKIRTLNFTNPKVSPPQFYQQAMASPSIAETPEDGDELFHTETNDVQGTVMPYLLILRTLKQLQLQAVMGSALQYLILPIASLHL